MIQTTYSHVAEFAKNSDVQAVFKQLQMQPVGVHDLSCKTTNKTR